MESPMLKMLDNLKKHNALWPEYEFCGLCHRPLAREPFDSVQEYGEYGTCHEKCIEQYCKDVVG